MSTRGAVLFEVSDGCYEAYYNHCDSYPTWLGVKLAELLKQGKLLDDFPRLLGLEDYGKVAPNRYLMRGTFGRDVARQAFELQGDLEWVYVVDFSPPSLQIFRTSNPDLIGGPDFVFSVWFSYVEYFPENSKGTMRQIERIAEITLNGLAAYHGAIKKQPVG